MRILFPIDRYHPSKGGAEGYLRDLTNALTDRGHDVTIAALEAEDDGVGQRLLIPGPSHPRLFREIAFALKISRIKKSGRFDRVVGFRHVLDVDRFQPHEGLFIESLEGALRAATASLALRRILFLKKLMAPKNLFFLYSDRLLFQRNPGLKVAALSKMSALSIRRRYSPWKPDVSIIPNGVDRNRFCTRPVQARNGSYRHRLALPTDCRLLLFVAHNFRLKGLEEALQGMAEYRIRRKSPFALLVAGNGKSKTFTGSIRRLGLHDHIFFLGAVSDMPALFSEADLLLHPTFYDPCSLVVLEALGSGVPVITSQYNGAAELMAGCRAGKILSDPRDPHSMADALEAILDSNHRQTYRDNAHTLGTRLDFQHHVHCMEDWILSE
ncbi:MAG: glycosyltransferase family 4 protein [Planctomycetes bacterium]|nr:glycosyltransferase family 4 protein [Planctomycetota bacterium]